MRLRHEPLTLETAFEFRIAVGASQGHANTLVRVEHDGIEGLGEASPSHYYGESRSLVEGALAVWEPCLGDDPFALGAIEDRMHAVLRGHGAAHAAIEMALHDALGRARHLPAHDLLGGKRRDRVAILRMVGTGKGAAADVADAQRGRADGYVAFKIKVGVAGPREDAERTRRICEALAGNASLLLCADANQGWTPDQAVEYVRAVENTTLAYFEQPVSAHDIEGMAQVARASRIPIGCDEGLHSLEDLKRHHDAHAAGGFSLKTIKLGGLKPVMDAGLLCEKLGMKVNLASKMAETGISTAALLHLAAALPAVDWGVGLSSPYLTDDILEQPLSFANGHVSVPAGPGLGIEIDEAKVRRYAREA